MAEFVSVLQFVWANQKPIIAFDLHGVVFKKDVKHIGKRLINMIFTQGAWRYVFNIYFLTDLYKIRNRSDVAEHIFKELLYKYPEINSLRESFIELSNAQIPISSTVDYIKELKEEGYSVFVLSNIGPDTYKELHKKFSEVLEFFDGVFIPQPEQNYLHKPDLSFYAQFKLFLKNHGYDDKKIVFIDDKAVNVKAAEKVGIKSIQYKNKYSLDLILE